MDATLRRDLEACVLEETSKAISTPEINSAISTYHLDLSNIQQEISAEEFNRVLSLTATEYDQVRSASESILRFGGKIRRKVVPPRQLLRQDQKIRAFVLGASIAAISVFSAEIAAGARYLRPLTALAPLWIVQTTIVMVGALFVVPLHLMLVRVYDSLSGTGSSISSAIAAIAASTAILTLLHTIPHSQLGAVGRVILWIVVFILLVLTFAIAAIIGNLDADESVTAFARRGALALIAAGLPFLALPMQRWISRGEFVLQTIDVIVAVAVVVLTGLLSRVLWVRLDSRLALEAALPAVESWVDWTTDRTIHTVSTRQSDIPSKLTTDLTDSIRAWREAARERVIIPTLRSYINEIVRPAHTVELRVHEAPGLQRYDGFDYIVQTATFAKVETTLRGMSGGAVGLAGPRGVGKTSILDATAHGRISFQDSPASLVIRESVPVKYDARDFMLHLYARVCGDYIEFMTGPGKVVVSSSKAPHIPRKWKILFGFILVLALLFSTVGPDKPEVAVLLILIIVIMAAWSRRPHTTLAIPSPFRSPRSPAVSPVETLRLAQERLFQIKFQQRYSAGWSGKLALPTGAELAGTRSREVSEAVRSYPEIVHDFQSFLSEILPTLPGGQDNSHVKAVFLIDELDKMSSWESAEIFINEIKSIFVFDQPGCLYLVSVSEEALNSFELEGVAVRDAFNSSFDEIVRVDYLTLLDAQRLLRSRVVGMPVAFECLCHCLSGGLPRELIRVARSVVGSMGEDNVATLQSTAAACVSEDLLERLQGLRSSVASSADNFQFSSVLLATLERLTKTATMNGDLIESAVADLVAYVDGLANRPQAAAFQIYLAVLAHLYYCCTLLSIFINTRSATEIEAACRPTSALSLEGLARSRVQVGFNPYWSWSSIKEVRLAWGLDHIQAPIDAPLSKKV